MNTTRLVARLENFGRTLPVLVAGLTEEEARWKPPSGAWSILEICAHLVDEETEDFGTRLRMMMEDPGAPWPKYDPEGRAKTERYNEKDLGEVVAKFASERKRTVEWLRAKEREGAGGADWAAAYLHPRVGPVPAGELLVSWAAHDALHIRQIAKRMFELAARDGMPEGYKTAYAGEWGA